jgi:hypothetical protein
MISMYITNHKSVKYMRNSLFISRLSDCWQWKWGYSMPKMKLSTVTFFFWSKRRYILSWSNEQCYPCNSAVLRRNNETHTLIRWIYPNLNEATFAWTIWNVLRIRSWFPNICQQKRLTFRDLLCTLSKHKWYSIRRNSRKQREAGKKELYGC